MRSYSPWIALPQDHYNLPESLLAMYYTKQAGTTSLEQRLVEIDQVLIS